LLARAAFFAATFLVGGLLRRRFFLGDGLFTAPSAFTVADFFAFVPPPLASRSASRATASRRGYRLRVLSARDVGVPSSNVMDA
jgi:hypothetical protein